MGVTVQKNFIFEQSVAEHLEELARFMRTSVDTALQEIIEERYVEIDKRDKLKAFETLTESIKTSGSNSFLDQYAPDDVKVVQKIKEIMASEL